MIKTPNNRRSLERLLKSYIESSELLENSEIAQQRVRAINAYHGVNHKKRPNLSNHISRDVFDTVESEKALLLETFAGARKIIRFKPTGPQDIEGAKLRNAYLNHLFWEQNEGYQLLNDGVHNALVEKMAAYKYWWDEEQEIDKRPFYGNAVTLQAAQQQMQTEGYQLGAVEQVGPDMFAGEFVRIEDRSYVKIKCIAPECLRIDPQADSIANAAFVGEECDLSGSDLVEMGVDRDMVGSLKPASELDTTVKTARKSHDKSGSFKSDEDRTADQELYRVVDCYIRIDLDDDGISELYQIWAGPEGELLTEPEPVSAVPIVADSLIPLPHKFHGMAPAETLIDIQETTSDIKRQLVDHLARANSQRHVADLSVIRNPMDFIENHVGGVIDAPFVQGQAPVTALAQPQLSPATTGILETMNQEKESRSGVSRLAQGLNQAAVSNQNADSLIDRLTNASNRRTMMKARNFAELILKPLLKGVYRLAVEMDSRPVMLQVSGQWQQVSPKQLGRNAQLYVDMAVTEDEALQRANTLLAIDARLAQSPRAAVLYPEAKQYALISDALEMLGESSHLYIEDPTNPQAQKSIVQLQQALQQMQGQNQQLQNTLQAVSQQHNELRLQFINKDAELRLKAQTEAKKLQQKDRDLDIKEDDTEHKQAVDLAELEIERNQGRGVDV